MGKGSSDPQYLKPSRRRRRPFPRLCNSHLLSMLLERNVWYSMFITILFNLHAEASAKKLRVGGGLAHQNRTLTRKPSQTDSYIVVG